jgi:hypothetical protein
VTSDRNAPCPRLASIDRRQLLLRTVDVERLIDEDHSARSIWELVGRLDLGLYYAQIAAVEGQAGRDHTDSQLLISLWLYAYSRGISSARRVADPFVILFLILSATPTMWVPHPSWCEAVTKREDN